jgi:hypothetical protein
MCLKWAGPNAAQLHRLRCLSARERIKPRNDPFEFFLVYMLCLCNNYVINFVDVGRLRNITGIMYDVGKLPDIFFG